MTPDYEQHDAQYRWLREMGCSGWGGKSFPQRMAGWQATVDALLGSSLFPSHGDVLELGSGAGDSLMPFAEAGYRVTGIEISRAAVAWAEEKFATRGLAASLHVGNIAHGLPFAAASFDVVIDAACLHCIIGEDRARVFAAAHRVLRDHAELWCTKVSEPARPGAAAP
jgi:SAM-dependent methyltransferase